MEKFIEQPLVPATSQEEAPKMEQGFAKTMEGAKQEVQNAIQSGDVKLALNAFLRLNKILPTGRGEQQFDYAGSFAKNIMQKAIQASKKEGASYEDVKFMVEVYLSLREYFPTSNRGESFDYAGTFVKDVMQKVIGAAKDGVGDAKLAREALNELRPYIPTENRGKQFDYAGVYEKDINRL